MFKNLLIYLLNLTLQEQRLILKIKTTLKKVLEINKGTPLPNPNFGAVSNFFFPIFSVTCTKLFINCILVFQ